jgi:hypothetical protein
MGSTEIVMSSVRPTELEPDHPLIPISGCAETLAPKREKEKQKQPQKTHQEVLHQQATEFGFNIPPTSGLRKGASAETLDIQRKKMVEG